MIYAFLYLFIAKEMLGELFTPVETPEAPNRGFFKGLFGGGAQSLDREELCKSFEFCIIMLFPPRYCLCYQCIQFSKRKLKNGMRRNTLILFLQFCMLYNFPTIAENLLLFSHRLPYLIYSGLDDKAINGTTSLIYLKCIALSVILLILLN